MVCIKCQEGSWNHCLCCNLLISWSNNDSRYCLNHGENAVWWKDIDQLLGLCCILWFMLDSCTFNDTSVNTVITCSFYYEFFLAIFNPLFILGNWQSVNVKVIFFVQCNAAMQRWCTLFTWANIMKDRPGGCYLFCIQIKMLHGTCHMALM